MGISHCYDVTIASRHDLVSRHLLKCKKLFIEVVGDALLSPGLPTGYFDSQISIIWLFLKGLGHEEIIWLLAQNLAIFWL
jgi:hypothetical protein